MILDVLKNENQIVFIPPAMSDQTCSNFGSCGVDEEKWSQLLLAHLNRDSVWKTKLDHREWDMYIAKFPFVIRAQESINQLVAVNMDCDSVEKALRLQAKVHEFHSTIGICLFNAVCGSVDCPMKITKRKALLLPQGAAAD